MLVGQVRPFPRARAFPHRRDDPQSASFGPTGASQAVDRVVDGELGAARGPASVARFQAGNPVAAELDACLSEMEVAEVGGRLLGVLHRTPEKIEPLHVDELHKRQGIGSALLAHAEADGARRLDVRAFNDDAIGFYERTAGAGGAPKRASWTSWLCRKAKFPRRLMLPRTAPGCFDVECVRRGSRHPASRVRENWHRAPQPAPFAAQAQLYIMHRFSLSLSWLFNGCRFPVDRDGAPGAAIRR